MAVVTVLIGAAIGTGVGALAGLLVQLSAKNRQGRTQWAFVGSPGRGAILGAVVGIVFALYFGGPYGWRPEAQSSVVVLTSEAFDSALDDPKPLIAVFYSDTCPTCNGFAPAVEELADEYESRLTVAKINATNESALFDRFDVKAVPTTLYFANGKQVDRTKGKVSLSRLRERAEALLAEQIMPAEEAGAPAAAGQSVSDESAVATPQ
ncbi:MAG: thioredoxin family protein [Verrucomicrobia bacterium]|nr:thioredoxin family protein [Verrucomicrobiota bacterium]